MRMQVASRHAFSIALFLTTGVAAGQQVQRPAITGVSHVTFYTTTPDAASHFYGDLLGLTQNDHSNVFFVGRQAVQTLAEHPPNPPFPSIEHRIRHSRRRAIAALFAVTRRGRSRAKPHTDGARWKGTAQCL